MTLKRHKPLTRKTPLRAKPTGNRMLPKKARMDGEAAPLRRRTPPTRHFRRGKKRPPATPAERAHMQQVRAMDCWCCEIDGTPPDPTNLHHPKEGLGGSQRASHWEVLPICEGHHQGMKKLGKLAYHKAPRTWKLRYGNEIWILRRVYERLGLDFNKIPELRGSEPRWWKDYLAGKYDEEPPEEARRILTLPQEQP